MRCCNHLRQTRVPSNGVLGVPRETLEYKLFTAIEFCIEVPCDGQRSESNIFKGSQACCDRYKRLNWALTYQTAFLN